MRPEWRFSCVLFMSCRYKIFTWFKAGMLGQQLHLLLFYLQYPPPVCIVCCVSRVQTTFVTLISLASPTYLRPLPHKVGQNLHWPVCMYYFQVSGPHHPFTWLQTSIWIDFATKSPPLRKMQPNKYKKENEIQHPPRKTFTQGGLWRNMMQKHCKAGTQDQDPTKQMAFVIICSMHPEWRFSCVLFMSCTFKIFAWFRHAYGVNNCICCFSIFSTPHLFAWFCCILTFATFLFLVPPNMLHRLLPTLGKKPRVLLFNLQGPAACLNGFKTLLGIDFAKKS